MGDEAVDELVERGFAALAARDTEAAIDAGLELKERRHSASFELLALAYEADGDVERAIAVLEEGVVVAPGVWELWHLLGNLRSGEELFDQAQEAYDRALQSEGANVSMVRMNRGIALQRAGDEAAAVAELVQVVPADLPDPIGIAALARAYVDVGSVEGGRRIGTEALADLASNEWDPMLAELHVVLGEIALEHDEDDDAALSCAQEALAIDRCSFSAFGLIRDVERLSSDAPRMYLLLYQGQWPEPLEEGQPAPGFHTTYFVIADDVDEARVLAERFEPDDVRETLKLDPVDELETMPATKKGVFQVTGYSFFLPE